MLGTAENWRHASTPQPQAGLSLCDARETGEETTRGVCPGGKVFGGKMYGPARWCFARFVSSSDFRASAV
jgi:hypothetical protein